MGSNFPKGEIKQIQGQCIVLKGDDIDTDRIIPARFLKCISFQHLGNQVFLDDRNERKGSHPFDLVINKDASILVVNENFGCGSSREHAPQALMRWGVRAIIGQSFAEIFYGNCLALGIPCLTSTAITISQLQDKIQENNQQIFELNIKEKFIKHENKQWELDIESGSWQMLITGHWDATSQLISRGKELNTTIQRIPYLNNFSDY